MKIKTVVSKRVPQEEVCCGWSRPDLVVDVPGEISQGLAKRLVKYAAKRLKSVGFNEPIEKNWPVEVYTMDAENLPADRTYVVKRENKDGGIIEVIGIFTKSGHPFLDHGLSIQG